MACHAVKPLQKVCTGIAQTEGGRDEKKLVS